MTNISLNSTYSEFSPAYALAKYVYLIEALWNIPSKNQPVLDRLLSQLKIMFTIFPSIECRIEADGIDKAICDSHIRVGSPPIKPENFTCISENWQNLNCTWDIPYNPVTTVYKLFYWEPGRRGR